MRLTTTQHQYILQAAHQNFGTDANVWLFGSRVDDERRGGDVDLYVETAQASTHMSALRCKIALEENLDLHVDLVVKEHGKDKPIYQIEKKWGSNYDRAFSPDCQAAQSFATNARISCPFSSAM
jgi:predicted nucleotidyltransferase